MPLLAVLLTDNRLLEDHTYLESHPTLAGERVTHVGSGCSLYSRVALLDFTWQTHLARGGSRTDGRYGR